MIFGLVCGGVASCPIKSIFPSPEHSRTAQVPFFRLPCGEAGVSGSGRYPFESRFSRSKCVASLILACFCQADSGHEGAVRQSSGVEGAPVHQSRADCLLTRNACSESLSDALLLCLRHF